MKPAFQCEAHCLQDVLEVLADFKSRHAPDRHRKEYRKILQLDMCAYYNYNEFLMEKVMALFPATEVSIRTRSE